LEVNLKLQKLIDRIWHELAVAREADMGVSNASLFGDSFHKSSGKLEQA
jgi:hypothetical protein